MRCDVVGTEIRTFSTLKDMNDYLVDQINQYRALYEDYSQWLGSLLRSWEENCKNQEWYQKSAAMQKNLRGASKKTPETQRGKKNGGGKGKNSASSCWVNSGEILLCSTEQGQAEILFEAIEQINANIQGLEKFKNGAQQLERIGFGKNVNYITLIKDDVPCKIVIRAKNSAQDNEPFSFMTDMSVPALFSEAEFE
jgi:hypothetical protein